MSNMPKIEVELTKRQEEAVIDAVNAGLVQAIEELEKACPELGPYLSRWLLMQRFSEALVFTGQSLITSNVRIQKKKA